MSESIWYYMDASTGAPAGPVDVILLQGLLSSGHIQLQTHVWCEGQPEWMPLKDVRELKSIVQVAQDVAKKAKQAAGPIDELAVFQAEVAAIEAEAAEEAEAPGTPEELEFEDDDGTIYLWDPKLRKYMPKDAGPSADYDQADMTFVEDEEVIPSLEEARLAAAAEAEGAGAGNGTEAGASKPQAGGKAGAGVKRPAEAPAGAGASDGPADAAGGKGKKGGKKGKPQAPPQDQGWFDLKNNTSIYINGLPLDVTVEEIHEACSKFGLVKEDEQKRPRIKLYKHRETGALKGDALVTFLREPSVALAVNLLDGARLRPEDTRGPIMAVQPAKFEQKGDTYQPKAKAPSHKKARKAVLEKQERLLGWGGFDDKVPLEKVTVILHHMFRPNELASELGAAAELEAEVLAEAKQLGPVEKVRVYKDHPDGVVSIKFKQEAHAAACLAKMNGRYFGGQQIIATMFDGITNYASVKVTETAEEQEARLEAYARELEAQKVAKETAKETAAAGGDGASATKDDNNEEGLEKVADAADMET